MLALALMLVLVGIVIAAFVRQDLGVLVTIVGLVLLIVVALTGPTHLSLR